MKKVRLIEIFLASDLSSAVLANFTRSIFWTFFLTSKLKKFGTFHPIVIRVLLKNLAIINICFLQITRVIEKSVS